MATGTPGVDDPAPAVGAQDCARAFRASTVVCERPNEESPTAAKTVTMVIDGCVARGVYGQRPARAKKRASVSSPPPPSARPPRRRRPPSTSAATSRVGRAALGGAAQPTECPVSAPAGQALRLHRHRRRATAGSALKSVGQSGCGHRRRASHTEPVAELPGAACAPAHDWRGGTDRTGARRPRSTTCRRAG